MERLTALVGANATVSNRRNRRSSAAAAASGHAGVISAGVGAPSLTECVVTVADAGAELRVGVDESYTLTVAADPAARCTIDAQTTYGAMRAMETFVQLTRRGPAAAPTHGVVVAAATVRDKPRFPVRATMIDTARHFYPLSAILQHLDAMSAVKMNVLHWHIVDAQSFPYVSEAFPQLSEHGAFHPGLTYTASDIRTVVDAAAARGIVVVPEIDTPGHVWAGFAAVDGLLTTCYDQGGSAVGTGPLDPSKGSTFTFLQQLLAEIVPLFRSGMFMVGGDEVDYGCWLSNPSVVKFAAAQGWGTGNAAMQKLENYYAQKLLGLLAGLNTSVMCWEELFDNGLDLSASTVVNVWKGGWEYCSKPTGGSTVVRNNKTCTAAEGGGSWFGRMRVRDGSWASVMSRAAAAGHRTVLSSPFYLNVQNYGSNFNEDWPYLYAIEPTAWDATDAAGRALTDDDKEASVAGVEACMWSEWVDGANVAPRFWPRAAAVAERGWSPSTAQSIDDFRRRVHALTCEFQRRGLPAEPVTDGGQFFHANGTLCGGHPGPRVLGPPEPGCLPRFSWCPTDASE